MRDSSAPDTFSEEEYDAIAAGIKQTERGRRFLALHAERHRGADTQVLLSAINRLGTSMDLPRVDPEVNRIRNDLMDMSVAISQTKREIAAMKPDAGQYTTLVAASEELDGIVEDTERATNDILQAAELVQETAWTMREAGCETGQCDDLNARATDIYTACGFQDLTGQRIHKVVDVIRFLEERLNAMIDVWGLDDIELREIPDDGRGDGLDQDSVDKMIASPAGETAPAMDNEAPADDGPEPAQSPGQSNRTPSSDPPVDETGCSNPAQIVNIDDLDEVKIAVLFA